MPCAASYPYQSFAIDAIGNHGEIDRRAGHLLPRVSRSRVQYGTLPRVVHTIAAPSGEMAIGRWGNDEHRWPETAGRKTLSNSTRRRGNRRRGFDPRHRWCPNERGWRGAGCEVEPLGVLETRLIESALRRGNVEIGRDENPSMSSQAAHQVRPLGRADEGERHRLFEAAVVEMKAHGLELVGVAAWSVAQMP